MFNYFLIFRIFIQYRDVKAFMLIDNILSYELNNRVNFKIKQCASLYSFSQIILNNHHRLHCLWRKHVHTIYVDLFEKCRHSYKMQSFFLFVKFSSLTIITARDIFFTIFVKIVLLISISYALINIFSIFIFVFVMQLLKNLLLIFNLIDDLFKKYVFVRSLKQLFIAN